MYLWRCWINSRPVLAIYLLIIALISWGVLRHGAYYLSYSSEIEVSVFYFLVGNFTLLGLAAWILGSLGIGRDIADGSGAFLLTRPQSRRAFVWTDSLVAIGELIILILISMGAFLLSVHMKLIRFSAPPPFWLKLHPNAAGPNLTLWGIPLFAVCMLLFAALVYSITYLLTVLIRRTGMAIFISAAFLLIYSMLDPRVQSWHRPYNVLLPNLMLNPFNHTGSPLLIPHLGLSIFLRVCVIMALLLAAQLVVERIDIRA